MAFRTHFGGFRNDVGLTRTAPTCVSYRKIQYMLQFACLGCPECLQSFWQRIRMDFARNFSPNHPSQSTKMKSWKAQNSNLRPSWTQEAHRERVCTAHAAKKSRRSRPRRRQGLQKHQVGQARERSVGERWTIGGRSMEQVGGMTAAGGGGGRR